MGVVNSPSGHNWNVSSVGLEHYFDRVGVTGSSPVRSTIFLQAYPLSFLNLLLYQAQA